MGGHVPGVLAADCYVPNKPNLITLDLITAKRNDEK